MEIKYGRTDQRIETNSNNKKRISVIDFFEIQDDFDFYDFESMCAIKGHEYKISFSSDFEDIRYGDIGRNISQGMFSEQSDFIKDFILKLVTKIVDEKVIVKKYAEKWVERKADSFELYKLLKHNKVCNKGKKDISFDADEHTIELFIDSNLKYNTFSHFLFYQEGLIISVTDHMDIFAVCRGDETVLKVKNTIDEINRSFANHNGIFVIEEIN